MGRNNVGASLRTNILMETSGLSTTEGAVLGLLFFGERSGYEIARDADDSIAYLWTPSRSQIYKVLPRLVEAGLARTRAVTQQRRPDKALYRLTPLGSRTLRAWVEEVEEEPADSAIFPLKLFFCGAASPKAADAQLRAYRRWLERRLAEYEDLRRRPGDPGYHFHPQLVLGHGITRLRALLSWADEAEGALRRRATTRSQQAARHQAAPTGGRVA
jgi:DNA-binding PadR family transcriptional regulator